jgi:hypothetical protein
MGLGMALKYQYLFGNLTCKSTNWRAKMAYFVDINSYGTLDLTVFIALIFRSISAPHG